MVYTYCTISHDRSWNAVIDQTMQKIKYVGNKVMNVNEWLECGTG